MSDRTISLLFAPKDNPALVPSGYGKIAQYTTPILMDAGFDVRLHCPVGHQYNTMTWREPRSGKVFEIWSGGNGPYGEDIVPLHLQKLAADTGKHGMYLFCGDAVALNHAVNLLKDRSVLGACWTAVDWEAPSPPAAKDKFAPWLGVFSMSQFGHSVLLGEGLQNLLQPVWPGCDTNVWQPLDRSGLTKTMNSMGFQDTGFNVFSCFANQYQRKGEYEMFCAVLEFNRRHPEAGIHFFALTQVRREWDLAALVHHLGMNHLVTLSDDYSHIMGNIVEEDVVRMMNSADCVLSIGYEGFGFQTIEAQACNVPVIGFGAGATPELLRAGVLVPPGKEIMAPSLIRRPLPDVERVVEALEMVWQAKQEGVRWVKGRPWVEQNLTWKHTANGLVRNLDILEQRIADEELLGPPTQGPLAIQRAKELVNV